MSASCKDSSGSDLRPNRTHEFPAGATHWPADLSRRNFLQVMGASLALSGLNACTRQPTDKIISYVTPPEKTPTTDAAWYATAMPWQGFARGILAKSVQGRPIKLEGNPDHPESLGATDAVTQAAILGLYDPDRSTTPLREGRVSSWNEFEEDWATQRTKLEQSRGAGFAFVTEPTTSPTLLQEIAALLDAWPEARWYQHTPLARFDRGGEQRDFDFARADIVLSLGADPLFSHPSSLRYARGFSTRRRIEEGSLNRNLLFALEPTLTLTGAQADVRLGIEPSRIPVLLNALTRAWDGSGGAENLSVAENRFVDSLIAELKDGKKTGVCVVGEEMSAELQIWADRFNARFSHGTVKGSAAVRSDGNQRCQGGLTELLRAMESGEVTALAVLGTNPVYTGAGQGDFSAALKRIGFSFHVGEYADETAVLCRWHLPESHFLETWGDLRAYSGAATILQPLIAPMHASRSLSEVMRLLRLGATPTAYELVRETWRKGASDSFEQRWHEWLNRGVIPETETASVENLLSQPATVPSAFPLLQEKIAAVSADHVTLLFRADSNVLDGRWANNAWLQELPRPFSSLVWENVASVSAELAAEQKLLNGDVLEFEVEGRRFAAPIWILPGQAKNCVTLTLGYGRTRGGSCAVGAGFTVYLMRASETRWQREAVAFRRAGKKHVLVSTQEHFSMEGRDPVHTRTLSSLQREEAGQTESTALFPSWPRTSYAWGMSIDLSTCYGCNACVVACQAENNIPVVGREQVGRGREMHWIRVDRYFSGEGESLRVLHQPVPCMHCEQAPCEVVCPVGATVHSSEGLNDMIYNRCVGTRYCSNNCPYKVRRFNFLDYHAPRGAEIFQQSNPDVTVRERGVMEKCTYCVQRINAGRIAAEKGNRRVRDGEIRTACQQACPVEAIVFGDLADPASRVIQRKKEKSSYALLGELNTKPRTTYLAKITADDFSAKKGAGVV